MTDTLYYNSDGRFGKLVTDMKTSGHAITELISGIKNPVGLEIGTDVGETAKYLLENNPNLLLHCIDPYINYTDWNGNNINDRDYIYQQVKTNLSVYKDRFVLYRLTSDAAVGGFEDESFDFIFIDGLHEYDQVLKDCRNYYSKVKTGGVFCGHDFNTIQGVNNAVREFAASVNKEILTTYNDVWYWIK